MDIDGVVEKMGRDGDYSYVVGLTNGQIFEGDGVHLIREVDELYLCFSNVRSSCFTREMSELLGRGIQIRFSDISWMADTGN